nr:MAG TPA: hypothetical protein [Caudoviricetes sp.]
MPESLLLFINILKGTHGQAVRPTHDRSGKETKCTHITT